MTAFATTSLGRDRAAVRASIADRLMYSMGKDPRTATARDWYHAAAYAVRDRLVERWMDTMRSYYDADAKRVYYLSMEFLTGRLLTNGVMNVGLHDAVRDALADLDLDFDEVAELEPDAALGNGGLGRLAACMLDSMATQSLPGYGYGIRYEYGLFFQAIDKGAQVEHPDHWLRYGNPWELPRPEVFYPVRFGGRVVEQTDECGVSRAAWVDTDEVMAMAFDTPVPGYGTTTVNHMRLWSARASRDFNLQYFNEGNYIKAVQEKTESENLAKVLYPDDTTEQGRELRLKQQYFFVSASLQDILRRFLFAHKNLDDLPAHVALQMNDTHPSIAIAELMRMLVDTHHLAWDRAWDITRRTCAYTNHTLMPEALETWPVALFERVLPRHLQIIYAINQRFLDGVRAETPHDEARVQRMSLIDEHGERRVRMAHLAVVGSHRVNGVSAMHSELMKRTIFADFDRALPETFVNVTNGVTPRRWLHHANPGLSALISEAIGDRWIRQLDDLGRLAPLAEDDEFQARFMATRYANKERLGELIAQRTGVRVNPHALFDVHVKRIHEYKRQLLNVLHVITRYNRIRDGRTDGMVPRTAILAGKAAPGYAMAKLIIRLIHHVGDVVNRDPAVGDWLKVAFVPNYSVSNAERIIPASDLSEQISTAGTEASGTGNMKLALNGALTIGTLDGATIEMRDEIGADNMFIFGLTAQEVADAQARGYRPWEIVAADGELRRALDMVLGGVFSPEQPGLFRPIVESLTTHGDRYMVLADYAAYVACQDEVDALYQQPAQWARKAILNVAGMGRFSCDRTVADYARSIWGVTQVRQLSASSAE